jgi:AbrB family looped-hinge helix DNA binding protein
MIAMTTAMPITARATMISKGRVTIPKSVRERLRLKAGDQVQFAFEADGTLRLLPCNLKAADLYGMLGRIKKPKKALTIEEMDKAIMKSVRKRDARSKRGR